MLELDKIIQHDVAKPFPLPDECMKVLQERNGSTRFVTDQVFLRICSICKRQFPINIIDDVYVCCDCRKKES